MLWTINQKPDDKVMFRGQGSVQVKNRQGVLGRAKVEYHPVCQVVGPVVEDLGDEPDRQPELLDRRPMFRS